jgi:hypothetical protein
MSSIITPARLIRVVDHQHPPPALPGGQRAHQPGPARAQDDDLVFA